ncbi:MULTISPECIES: MFS transporter [Caproicibacterium]|uniref:MFS transporter n=1 Tax=Caproicibacterium argilliputei TaxID=3030016 RepID=A0AA97H2Q1_9FIRM|nr:MFS transporter [Caproicibacterium argilliputei]WOC32492.1 MFS transporter [Caproicibacterium argilliputei]
MNKFRKYPEQLYFLYYTLLYAGIAVYGGYISIYYMKAGFSLSEIGTLTTVGPLFSLFVQPVWGMVSDRTGRHRLVLTISLIGSVLSVLLYSLHTGYVFYLIITMVFMLFYTAIQPLSDTISVDYLTRSGYNYSAVRMGGSIGYSVVVLLLGNFFNDHLSLLFALCAGLLLLALFSTALLPKEQPKPDAAVPDSAPAESKPFNRRRLILLIGFSCVLFFALSFNISFVGIYAKEMTASGTLLGVALCASSISEVPVLLLITKYSRRFNQINIFTIVTFTGFLLGARMLLYFFAQGIGMVIFAQALQGITSMLLFYSMVTYINREVPTAHKATGQSALVIAQSGISSILGNTGGGYVSEWIGLRQTYLLTAVIVLAATALFAVAYLLHRKHTTQTRPTS